MIPLVEVDVVLTIDRNGDIHQGAGRFVPELETTATAKHKKSQCTSTCGILAIVSR